jgi:hypothetical protein
VQEMKRMLPFLVQFLCLAMIATAGSLHARTNAIEFADGQSQAGSPASSGSTSPNPLKVALLKWYEANTITSFPATGVPYGLAFDGANIWTANFNDGTILGAFTIGDGVEPYGVT